MFLVTGVEQPELVIPSLVLVLEVKEAYEAMISLMDHA